MAQLHVLNNVTSRTHPAAVPVASSAGERERLAVALADVLRTGSGADGTGGQVRFSRHDRLLYATDASLYQVEPIGVVLPASISDAERVVRWCGEHGVAMLPRGGGTSLAGQCTNHAVVIDLTPSCRKVRQIDVAGRWCEVEPGIGIDELNDHLSRQKTGLFFAPDPATTRQCAVGGAIGNNAAGARSVLYGRTSENVRRLDVALATGERLWLGPNAGATNPTARRLAAGVIDITRAHARLIRERFPKTIRRNAGYGLDMMLDQIEKGATPETLDLAKLLCGSEGTLAVTLGAELTLHPVPKAKGLALLAFDGVDAAIEATQAILKTGPCAVELLDDVVLEAARGNEQCRRYLQIMPRPNGADANAILYVEYFGFGGGTDEIAAKFAALRAALPHIAKAGAIIETTDAATMNIAWLLRKAGEPLLHGLPGNRKPITFVEDNAVPVERLAEFVREFRKIVTRHGTKAAYWAHASVGVLHVRPMIDIHDPEDRERLRAIAVEVADLARACGGIMSGEHGDGRVRGPLLERFFGPELMSAFRQVKTLFDPKGLLNPGNIVSPGPIESITENLRVDAAHDGSAHQHQHQSHHAVAAGADASPDTIDTFYDYSAEGGFAHAVEQCNGAGVCRKRSGLMCPSYQGSLDERHSTRGRGNALRLAITGQFPWTRDDSDHETPGHGSGTPNWNDPDTIDTLDLCLSCKACKSECPSNVDIAKLKAEYTAQRFRQLGAVPLAARLTGRVRWLNQLGSLTPELANRVNATAPARALINCMMGLHPKRSLPKFSRSLYAMHQDSPPRPDQPRVMLFTDCFTTYNESHIGMATIVALEAAGYHVALSPSSCCGRSMISVGMLSEAIESIDAALERLRPAIDDPNIKAIVVCEPSCLSAIKDDWLTLKCATPLDVRKRLAAKAMLPEEFLERFWNEHPRSAALATAISGPPVLLHAHCHQKSLWGAESSAKLLRRLVGDRLKVLDTGCCGMAGSFGFGAKKYNLSMAIGELSLLPIVRSAPSDAIIVAPGTSCRHQIHDGTARHSVHPMELLAHLLAKQG